MKGNLVKLALTLGVLASAVSASASEKVELSLSTTCDCFQRGSQSAYLGEVFAVAVVEASRAEVSGVSSRDLAAKNRIALEAAARAACESSASRHMVEVRQASLSGGLVIGDTVQVYCSADVRVRATRR